ncbi:C-C motif chemokine 3-like [Ahaetulla prasina]|uniref:C-C motif chemokine 3-like n=1 Tax=Ahaetulla prasina TaxID=499056 RepID=UPI0026489EC9|nr:C-C motif chemokine 3-like [Ahaetulla prasina]
MRSLFAFLFLVVSVALAVEGPSAAPEPTRLRDQNVDPVPNYCCFDFTKRSIPLSLLKSFYYTNSKCSKPAVVFITKRNKTICADPSEQWVQNRIRDLSPL